MKFNTEWVVYSKPPFAGPANVLDYLARYTHRVAISNHRLLALEDGQVRFHWRDYRHHDRRKTMTLDAHEFIRRFLLHALPPGFQRIRYFGFLAARCRDRLALCRKLLAMPAVEFLFISLKQNESRSEIIRPTRRSWHELMRNARSEGTRPWQLRYTTSGSRRGQSR